MRRRKWFILAVLVLLVAVAGIGLTSTLAWSANSAEPATIQQYGISWDVIASGGTTMSGSSYTMLSTTGQAVAGPSSGTEYTLLSGYWQKFISEILLPIIFG